MESHSAQPGKQNIKRLFDHENLDVFFSDYWQAHSFFPWESNIFMK